MAVRSLPSSGTAFPDRSEDTMASETRISAKQARHGEKMIEVKIRFWTDNISPEKGKIVPRHAWASGVVRIERNDAHGLKPGTPIPFNSLLDLGAAVEKALIEHGVVLHINRKMRKYFGSD
jgi:hypothetical protein